IVTGVQTCALPISRLPRGVPADAAAMVLVRREDRLREAGAAAFLPPACATVPAVERDAASELPHARRGAGSTRQGSRLAGTGAGPGRQRPSVCRSGAPAPRPGSAANAVPSERRHQPRVDGDV